MLDSFKLAILKLMIESEKENGNNRIIKSKRFPMTVIGNLFLNVFTLVFNIRIGLFHCRNFGITVSVNFNDIIET